MNTLLLATTNTAKRIEIAQGLQDIADKGLEIVTLKDVSIQGEPIESGVTFEENAKIKAKFYGDQTNLPTLSDDGGLMIDALNGEPGVKSRRWPGYEASDKELIQYALDKMKHLPHADRTAQLVTCICLYIPHSQKFYCEQEKIDGIMTEKPYTWDTQGYPYRALFKVRKYNKLYDKLTEAEHDDINHRLKALQKLKTHIKEQIIV